MNRANQPASGNGAITSLFHAPRHWRAVPEPGRWARDSRLMKKPNTPAYAVVRLDYFLIEGAIDATSLENAVTVKEVLLDQGRAEAEVERLNKLNADKQCRYFCQYTRLISDNEN